MPKYWATHPNKGGPSKKIKNEVSAKAAMLTAAGRSVLRAAADTANGKIALVPTPINAMPINAIQGVTAQTTAHTPTLKTKMRHLATRTG